MSGNQASPTIAVTLPAHRGGSEQDSRAASYRQALWACGARTVDVRPGQNGPAMTALHGLLLGGGGDLAPCCHGGPDSDLVEDVDAARDETELCLTTAALARELPILGICRGAQVLGLALGGELIQDIPTEVENALPHRGVWHDLELDRDSQLLGLLGAGRLRVNSSHHQANGCLGPDVRRAAWSADGVTEAIELEGAGFVIGVQWHPERMLDCLSSQRLFAAFVAACRRAMS